MVCDAAAVLVPTDESRVALEFDPAFKDLIAIWPEARVSYPRSRIDE
jgi:hypothetical protein